MKSRFLGSNQSNCAGNHDNKYILSSNFIKTVDAVRNLLRFVEIFEMSNKVRNFINWPNTKKIMFFTVHGGKIKLV